LLDEFLEALATCVVKVVDVQELGDPVVVLLHSLELVLDYLGAALQLHLFLNYIGKVRFFVTL
jgi:hypothetical protein